MKLMHRFFNTPLDFDVYAVQGLVIEAPRDLGLMISELNDHLHGLDSGFTAHDSKGNRIDRGIQLIVDPFSFDLNNKDIAAGIMRQMLASLTSPDNLIETDTLMSELQMHLLRVADDMDEDLTIGGIDLKNLLKASSVLFESGPTLSERIVDCVRLSSRFAGTVLSVFVNLSAFLSEDDYIDLVHNLEYLQNPVLLIESRDADCFHCVKILDSEFCEINRVRHEKFI